MTLRLLPIGLIVIATSAANAQTCCLRGDVNADLSIDLGDIGSFVATLLDPGAATSQALCAADTDSDGDVNGGDVTGFVDVLMDPDSALFDFGPPLADAEAEQIGLELLGPGGPLLVPPETYQRIDTDLDLIRAHTPALISEAHTPAWSPNQIIVKVLIGMPTENYDCLNALYQMIDEEFLFQSGGGNWYVLTFAGNLNVEALGLIYQAAPEVEIAEPNGIIGGANFWVPTPQSGGFWRWDIDDGFLDCFDGCDCHRLYVFRTSAAGSVNLVSYQEVGPPHCDF